LCLTGGGYILFLILKLICSALCFCFFLRGEKGKQDFLFVKHRIVGILLQKL
jgi:hypothetical protein